MNNIKHFFQRKMSLTQYILYVTILNLILFHIPLYTFVLDNIDISSWNGFVTFCVVIVSLFVVNSVLLFIFAIVSIKFLKYFTIAVMFLNPIALYFVRTYNIILDKSMMGNLFNTNSMEAMSYYHPKVFIFLCLGFIFAYLVAQIEIIKVARKRLLVYSFGIFIMGIIILYLNASRWLWLDSHAKKLGGLSMPWSYVINAFRYQLKVITSNQKQILLPPASFSCDDDTIVILVIGESARAKNFSLYGYKRETNPRLKTEDVMVLNNSISSATYTTASVHSILSYKGDTADSYEPLPNYLYRHGVEVFWRSNNWGEPKLKVTKYIKASQLKSSCEGEECKHDGVLLTGLKEEIENLPHKRTLYILHTNGSHGPSYYKKYPKEFEHFKPVCKTVDLKQCSNNELINAYDNTILYTDTLLYKLIEMLKKDKERASVLLYISDHGESLGEYGLYLHGTPYTIAPDVQKKIPFLIWTSQKFKEKKEIKTPIKTSEKEYGQYNIFHTILGAFNMHSPIYNKNLDIFGK
jgi:lipid A ethanolaminephosphotransferase